MSKKLLVPVIALATLLWSCGRNKDSEGGLKEAKGGVYYGGVFKTNEVEDFRSLFPLNITENVGLHISSMVFEGLVKLSQNDLSVLPCLAEKWTKSDDAKTWTFTIRKDVNFQDNPCFASGSGRELTAQDIKYCFDKLCESSADNQQFSLTFQDRVLGADEYYKSTQEKKPLPGGVSGVKVLDDHTIQITLKYSFAGFLNVLTMPGCWIYPKEAVDKYGNDIRINCVGTGPFCIKNCKEGDAVILEKNKKYWATDESGNQLPYLDGVKYSFIKDKKSELYEFKKGNLDMMFRLPTEMIPDILDEFNHAKEGNARFEMQRVPAMAVDYYCFQDQSEVFSKKDVRMAFNYAIDREKIVTYTLQGDGIPATFGIIPPSFANFDHKSLKGYKFNPDTAKHLLAAAGYPNGKGFPKISLQVNSNERNLPVAEIIQKMIKENLNVDLDINVLPFAEHVDNYESGKAMFWRAGWTADYPDPETFLTVLYGKNVPENTNDRSYINSSRFKNAAFDSLFELAMREVDTKKRMDYYRQADQVQINNGAILPVYYHENYRLVQLWIKNLEPNAMEYRDLSRVYFIPKDKIKKK